MLKAKLRHKKSNFDLTQFVFLVRVYFLTFSIHDNATTEIVSAVNSINTFKSASNGSTVVEQPTHISKVEGSNPAAGTGLYKIDEKT
jgi:hypothetical protein